MKIILVTVLTAICLTLTGCGVSQEDYDKLKQENDSLSQQVSKITAERDEYKNKCEQFEKYQDIINMITKEELKRCVSNLKQLATACEMYATDHVGRYPTSLSKLTEGYEGGYLKTILPCPAAGADTYSVSYSVTTNPDVFTIYCSGHHHELAGIPENNPRFDSVQGLIDPK